jgi:hypothetical protein
MAAKKSPRLEIRRRQHITLNVSSKITPEQVDAALRRIYEISGCTACGFLGFDLSIRQLVVNPAFAELGGTKFKGVESIDFEPAGQQQIGG